MESKLNKNAQQWSNMKVIGFKSEPQIQRNVSVKYFEFSLGKREQEKIQKAQIWGD